MHFKRKQQAGTIAEKSPERKIFDYFCIYTLLFIFITFIALFPFLTEGKCLIWKIDGMPQYLLWLQYTGEYLRDLFSQIIHGNFHLSMYDFSIGMGGDVRSFFKPEPVNLLGLFLVNDNYSWEYYSLLTIFRIYLIGIAFSCYGLYMKQKRSNVLAGALTYAFSSFTFYQILRHPQFYVGIIMLPLLCIGLEQLMKKKKMLFFTLMVAISLMASYYFLFMNTILMGIYVLLRIGEIYGTHKIRNFFQVLWRIIVSYLFGCGMSAVFFAPSIAGFFLSARTSTGTKAAAVGSFASYGIHRLSNLFLSLIAPVRDAGSLTTISVSVLIIPALILLFSKKRKKNLSLKIGFLLGLLFLMVPFFGYVFSGFSTVNNRWTFGFVFVLALVIMITFNQITEMTRKQYLILAGVTVLYGICWILRNPAKEAYIAAFLMLLLLLVLLGIFRLLTKLSPKKKQCGLILFLSLTLAGNGFFILSASHGNLIDQFQNRASANHYFSSSRYQYLTAIEDDSFYRTDTNMMYDNYNNTSVALYYNGISLYNSTIGSNTIRYFIESESTGISALNRTLCMDNRTDQEALACVKYYITTEDNSQNVPYGFTLDQTLSDQSEEYDIYVNQYPLSIGYTYDTVISRSSYEKLSALEKQEIQMKSAVLYDEDLDAFSSLPENTDTATNISEGELQITGVDEGIVQNGDTFQVKHKMKTETTEVDGKEVKTDVSPKIHFTTTSKKGCEVYLRFKDLTCNRTKRTDVNVYTENVAKRAIVRSNEDTYGLGMDDYLINLGYYDTDKTIEGEISFAIKGKYTFGAMEVYYVPMDSYEEEISSLNRGALENVQVSTNTVSGTISSDSDQLLAFSIPYHIGWKAYIDGKEAELYNVNTLYMGVPVPSGNHEITLTYSSPGIVPGAVISIICTALFVILVILSQRKKRRNIE